MIQTGNIIWFDLRKGNGFIRTDDGNDVPVSYIDIERYGRNVHAGDRVAFELASKPEGLAAVKVVVVEKKARPLARQDTSDSRPGKDPSVLVGQALVAKQAKEYTKARKLFEKAILEARTPTAFFSYASMEKNLGQVGRAGDILKRGIERFPNVGKLYEDYGMLELRREPAQAAAILREGLTKAPGHKILHRYLGEVLFKLGGEENLREAAQQLELARKHGRVDEQSLQLQRLANALIGHRRGRISIEFLKAAHFSIEHIESQNPHAIDLFARPRAIEYTESYDLVDEILVRCFFKTNVEIPDIVQFVNQLQTSDSVRLRSRDVGFVVVQNSSDLRDYLYRLLEGAGRNPTVIPIDEPVIRAALEAHDSEAVLKQILDEWLYRRNLYEESFPVSGRRFFGREQELAALTRAIDGGTPVGLFGLRKVGKTSLLKKLKEKRPQDLVAYVDLQSVPAGITHVAYLYWELANQIKDELVAKLPKAGAAIQFSLGGRFAQFTNISNYGLVAAQFDADLRSVKKAVEGGVVKVVILLDEIERLLPSRSNAGFVGYVDFLAYIRGRSQQDNSFVSIVTGANPAICEASQFEGRDNPVFKFFKEMFLPPLEELECDEMITKLGRGMGISYSSTGLDSIYLATGGHPFITRQLCSRIAKQYQHRPLAVTEREVSHGMDEFLFQDSGTFKEILDRLERDFPQEKELLLFIADGVDKETELANLAGPDVNESLRHLVGYQLIERSKGAYRIKIGLLLSWIRRHWLTQVR